MLQFQNFWTSDQGKTVAEMEPGGKLLDSLSPLAAGEGPQSLSNHTAATSWPPCDVLYTSEKRPISLDFPLPRGQAGNRGGRCIKGGHTNFWHCSDARNWQAALLPSLLAPRCQGCQTLECRGVDEKGAPRPWMQHQANPGIRISAISGRCFRLCRSFPR